MNKFMLATGCMVGYAYAMEFFIAWYSGNEYESWLFLHNRAAVVEDSTGAGGPYWWAYYSMVFCNVVAPQIFWSKKMRTNIPVMFVVTILINIGMWFERFVIIVTSLHRDYIPSAWNMYYPTLIDIGLYAGTIGFFMVLFLLFIRWIPMIAIAEVKAALPHAHPHHGTEDADEHSVAAAPAPAE
jgi:molybdopterin-containing oxidoreductase family membrane subunit